VTNTSMKKTLIWRKHYALPSEHGAWIWWVGPLMIGVAATGQIQPELGLLGIAVLAAFLLRQPTSILVKSLVGRRSRQDRAPALVWTLLYTAAVIMAIAGLVFRGQDKILLLGLPGLSVFLWHLWLVSRKEERGQPGVEIVAAGVLSLAAPAAYWVAEGETDRTAWLLWALTWLQSASSIVYVHLRLAQRKMETLPNFRQRLSMGSRTLSYYGFNFAFSLLTVLMGWMPVGVSLAFGVQLVEATQGVFQPAVGAKPTTIGIRQLLFSNLFVGMMIAAFLI
jgi:hypothetical protein